MEANGNGAHYIDGASEPYNEGASHALLQQMRIAPCQSLARTSCIVASPELDDSRMAEDCLRLGLVCGLFASEFNAVLRVSQESCLPVTVNCPGTNCEQGQRYGKDVGCPWPDYSERQLSETDWS